MKKIGSEKDESPAQLIDARIEQLDDWRGETLEEVRSCDNFLPRQSPGSLIMASIC
ncbi:MAG: hypothetical protein P8Y14_28985 [Anaerolineales bacterium]|jgi:hypothetical protein